MAISATNAAWLWLRHTPNCGNAKRASSGRTGGPAPLLDDAKVLECRARHEFAGWNEQRCARHYGTSLNYMRRMLAYETRSRLIAKPEHANSLECKA